MSGTAWLSELKRRMRRAPQRRAGPPRPQPPLAPDGVTVDPRTPPTLSGGAAAALPLD